MAELRTAQGHTLLLPEGCVSIGADPTNDVPVASHLGLAPVHFRLQPWEGGHFLEDAGSGLGTLVNGHPVNWKPLTHGDVIVAGELEVVYSQATTEKGIPAPHVIAPPPDYSPPPATGTIPATLSMVPRPAFPGQAADAPMPLATPLPAPLSWAGPAPGLASAPMAACLTPPAWLPEDLLPEAYRTPPVPALSGTELSPETSLIAPPAPPSASPSRPHRPIRRFRKRLLPISAVAALLAWAGHTAWQSRASAPDSAPVTVPYTGTRPSATSPPLPAPEARPASDGELETRRAALPSLPASLPVVEAKITEKPER